MCHDTEENDRARGKHASTRHPVACHGIVAHLSTRTPRQRQLHSRRRKERRARSCDFRALVQVWCPQAAQLRNRSAEHACNQALASTGWKCHKVNKTITTVNLRKSEIGDGGAIALAGSLKATLVMRFRLVRATLFLWPARTQPHRRFSVICVTSVFRCSSVGARAVSVRRDVARSRHIHMRRFMRLKPWRFRQTRQA